MKIKMLVPLLVLGMTTILSAKEKVVFWHAMGGKLQASLNKIVDEYNASQDKIEIEALYQGTYQDTLNKFKSVQGTRNAPAIIQLNEISTEYMYGSGAVTPIDNFIKRDNFDLAKLEDVLVNYYTLENKLYSMPFNSSASVLMYNKDAFKEAGLDPEVAPKSFKELEDMAKKLTINNERYGFALIMDSWYIEQLLANQNSLYVNEGNGREGKAPTEVVYNKNGELKKIYSWLDGMYRQNIATSFGNNAQSTRSAFASGKVTMYLDSSSGIEGVKELSNFEVGTAFIPNESGEFNGVPIGGASLWITNSTPDSIQDAAWDFIKFAVSPNSQALWASETGYYSVNKDAYQLDLLKEALKDTPQKLVAVEEIKSTKKVPATSGAILGVFPEVRKSMNDSLEALYEKKGEINTIISNLIKESNRTITRYNS